MSHDETTYRRAHIYMDARDGEPKRLFVRVADLLAERLTAPFTLLDVGAAAGDFLAYASRRFSGIGTRGVEADAALVTEAGRRHPGAGVACGDANTLDGIADRSCAAVTMTGTHSIFDDFRPSFGACLRVSAPNARVVITGLFNPFGVDARIHWRYAEHHDEPWQPGYNLFARASVARFLETHSRVAAFAFRPFEVDVDVPPREDPIRSWTERQPDGRRQLRNGIMPLTIESLVIDVTRE